MCNNSADQRALGGAKKFVSERSALGWADAARLPFETLDSDRKTIKKILYLLCIFEVVRGQSFRCNWGQGIMSLDLTLFTRFLTFTDLQQ